MDDIKRQAAWHIERVDKLRRQLEEVEDLQDELEEYEGEEFEIGIPMGTRWYRVKLMKDLGITMIQDSLKKKLIAELHIRKEVIEMTLTQLIGGDTK